MPPKKSKKAVRNALKARWSIHNRKKLFLKNSIAKKCSVCLIKYIENGESLEEKDYDNIVLLSKKFLSGSRGPETLLPKYKESSVMFLVTRLLGIPSTECVKYRVKYGDPSDWFNICDTCQLDIKTAEEIHNQILQLHDNLDKIKSKLMALMKIKSENEDEMDEMMVCDGEEHMPTLNWHDVAYDIRQYFLGKLWEVTRHNFEILKRHQVESKDEQANSDHHSPAIPMPATSFPNDRSSDVEMSGECFIKEELQFESEDLETEFERPLSDVELEPDADNVDVEPEEHGVEVGMVPSASPCRTKENSRRESDKETVEAARLPAVPVSSSTGGIQLQNGVLPFITITRNMSDSVPKPIDGTGSGLESLLICNSTNVQGKLFYVIKQNESKSNFNPSDGTGKREPVAKIDSSSRPDLSRCRVSLRPRNECTRCSEKFPSMEDLKSHIQDAHKDCLYCKTCLHVVAKAKTLENHIRRDHLPYITSQCRGCGQIMPRTDDFNRHLEVNSTCKSKALTCDSCSELFSSEDSLTLHAQVRHVENNLLRYECSTCKQRFKLRQTLQSHQVKEHAAPKLFCCEKCPRTFPNKTSLASHLKNVHLSKEPGAEKFICDICGRAFHNRSHYVTHLKLHGDESPYLCPTCGKTYKVSTQLNVHMWSHDPDRYEKYSLYKYGKGRTDIGRKRTSNKTTDDGEGKTKISVRKKKCFRKPRGTNNKKEKTKESAITATTDTAEDINKDGHGTTKESKETAIATEVGNESEPADYRQ